ncbi:hypothetical protein AAGS61_09355 [Lysinibacillus sp. KU-BSD001]|uniref:hypothetical protein n=1 Tax=Lysinibacillus sp. KU-BSD001 TaxID=3141328 RepID=UPI0036EB5F86
MGQSNMYDLCCKYQGKRVRITDNQGQVHVGTITRVNRRMVWIQPDSGFGGFGFGFWGPYYGRGRAFVYGVALGTVTGIVLASAFLW